MDANFEPDRRTEVGGPPTGQVPRDSQIELPTVEPEKAPSSSMSMKRKRSEPPAAAAEETASSNKGLLVFIALVVLAGGGIAVWQLTKSEPERVVVTPSDAAVVDNVEWGTVEIDPDPEGATGYISDVAGTVPEGGTFGPTSHKTPVRKRVEANKPFRVHIDLEGHAPYDKERTVKPNETLVIAPTLVKARATLVVTTTPPGAQVSLGGVVLGTTPLTRKDLEANPAAEIVISRAGFEPVRQKVALVAGKSVDITETLKAGQKFGQLKIIIPNGWGYAYLKGSKARLGRAPSETLRVPIGRQTIHLVNTGKTPNVEWDVTCEVSESETKTCTTKMP